jgi:formate hydrogenlyase subunit 3/multisubunit Na+/H+ antiporter MnhD subunit
MIDPTIIVVILYIAAALSLLGMKIKRANDVVSILSMGFALFAVILNFFYWPLWISLPSLLGLNFTINGFTNLIALIATFIGFLVLVYSIKYIENRRS